MTRYAHEPFIDTHCPRGHRFIWQAIGCRTEFEARAATQRIFGPAKAAKAVFVKGGLPIRQFQELHVRQRAVELPARWWFHGFRENIG
jgi:hypothetical protein